MAKELFATIYFDKNTEGAKSFGFDSFNESVASNTMNLSVRYEVADSEDIPDFSAMKGLTFSAMEISDKAGNNVPYFGAYTKIEDISVNYFSTDSIYTVNVMLA